MSPILYRSFSPGEPLCGLRETWSTMISAAVSMLFRATYEELYDIGGLMMSSEFLSQVRKTDIVRQAEGYGKEVLIIHGELDEKVPVYAVGPYLDLYGEKARLEIIKGANHQFTSVEWKNRVYELSIDYIKEKVGSTEKYLLED